MLRYLIKRLASGLVALFVLETALFFAMHVIMPGDFASQFAQVMSDAELEQLRQDLNLDKPLTEQYLLWLGSITQGTLGYSYEGNLTTGGSQVRVIRQPVSEALANLAPATILVFFTGLGLAYLIGQWLGRVIGWRGPTLVGDGVTFLTIAGYACFPPALVFLLDLAFVKTLKWMPSWAEFNYDFVREYPELPPAVLMQWMALSLLASVVLVGGATWLARRVLRRAIPAPLFALLAAALSLGLWFVFGFGVQAISLLRAAAIPIAAMTILSTGEMLVITRATMTDTRDEQYVLTARAKGLHETKVRDDHAAPNAILPILTRAGIGLPYLLGGLAIIESTLKWPGVGSALFNAAVIQDIPLVLGVMLFIGIVTLLVRLGLDVAYVLLEPRLRIQSSQH